MAKPTQLPRWATGGTAQVTEPTEGKKDVAWLPMEKPPAEYFNWILKTVYLWCAYLDGITNEAITWASRHTFSAGLSSDVAPVAYADVARKFEVDAEAGARAAADALRPLDTAVVHNTGAETIAGVKTFSSPPVVPAPGAGGEAANKAYADAREAAAKSYTDAKFPAVAWSTITVNATATPGAGEQAPAYWKDPCGVVHLRGFVYLTAGNNNIAITTKLPAGVRPIINRVVVVLNYTLDKGVALIIGIDGGLVLVNAVAGTTTISLDGATFIAEQ